MKKLFNSHLNELTLALVSSALFFISVPSYAGHAKNPPDCTQMTITEMKKALETHKLTSEQCVQQVLTKINNISPHNDPFAVIYTGDNVAAYNALIAQFHGLNAFASINASAITQAQQADQLRKG